MSSKLVNWQLVHLHNRDIGSRMAFRYITPPLALAHVITSRDSFPSPL